jgi:hypothetical protein
VAPNLRQHLLANRLGANHADARNGPHGRLLGQRVRVGGGNLENETKGHGDQLRNVGLVGTFEDGAWGRERAGGMKRGRAGRAETQKIRERNKENVEER